MKMYKCVYDYLTSCWNYFLHFQALEKRKLNIGAARSNYDKSWFSTDIDVLDITKFKDWFRILSFLKVDNIVAEHVWEHLSIDEARSANKNCHRFLKRNGVLRLAVPDGYHPSASYIEHVRPGGCGPGSDDHKVLYNYKTLSMSLEDTGFKIVPLEYWDEKGQFHFTEWTDENGRINRSCRYDKRNVGGELNYTSLIVDAIK